MIRFYQRTQKVPSQCRPEDLNLYRLSQRRRTQTYMRAGFESATLVLLLFKAALASYLAATVSRITYSLNEGKIKEITLRVTQGHQLVSSEC
jgi:hypothetical protein